MCESGRGTLTEADKKSAAGSPDAAYSEGAAKALGIPLSEAGKSRLFFDNPIRLCVRRVPPGLSRARGFGVACPRKHPILSRSRACYRRRCHLLGGIGPG